MSRKIGASHISIDLLAAVERVTKGSWPILPELCGAAVSVETHRFNPGARSEKFGTADPGRRDDLHVWELSVRCRNAHTRLAQELEGTDARSAQIIDALGDERRDTLLALVRVRSRTINGIHWKKDILSLFFSNDEEADALLASCVADCGRVLGGDNQANLPDALGIVLPTFSRVAETAEEWAREIERYDECEGSDQEDERDEIVSKIGVHFAALDAAIRALAELPTGTLGGLQAKLKLYETFAERGMTEEPLAALRRSMFDDLDRLLRKHAEWKGASPA